ncbi:MAG: hypothetical protein K6E29_06585 [Cyanobacteria bacterium RUI128]|nr:hypothetical protein [Cyanobacteria bacterium RUI128]
MVYKIHKVNLVIFAVLFMCLLLSAIFLRGNTETNLMRTLLPSNVIESANLADVVNKSSSVIKVVFEADSEQKLSDLLKSFTDGINKDDFEIYKPDVEQLLNSYIKSPTNFLSNRTRELLKSEKYDEVFESSMETLYSPARLQLTTMDKDPCLLLDDFIVSNRRIHKGVNNINEQYYDCMTVKIKGGDSSSPDLCNKKVKEIIKLQKKLSHKNSKIYLAGTPIHSFYTTKKSVTDINLICLFTTMFICLLTYFYFRDAKILIPMALSITFGMLGGYVATRLWFVNFHIITMVFSTTLIGIGIDYSYHYLFSKKTDKVLFRNLALSLLTTVTPFVLLYYTGIDLLKQIAVFTVFGMLCIYLAILLLYPGIDGVKPVFSLKINSKIYKYILTGLVCASFIGLIGIHFNDTITALYSPSKKMAKAENLYSMVSGDELQNTQIITVKGKNTEEIIEKEEAITDKFGDENIEYISISKFMPSVSRQKDNYNLVKKMYGYNLHRYSDMFSYDQIRSIKAKRFNPVTFCIKDFPYFNDFMLNPNTSMIFVFSNKNLQVDDKTANIVSLKSDTGKYIHKYRVNLLCLFPIVVIAFTVLLSLVCGAEKSIKIVSPSLYGAVCAIGLTSLVFHEINLFSVITMYIVMGLTIDFSIFRLNKEARMEDAGLASCLTTSFSFLLLALAGFKLLSSMAFVVFFGILVAYFSGYFIFAEQKE